MIPRLKELFVKEIQPNLKQQFGYKNLYMVPEIKKVVLNMGLGIDGNDAKIIKSCEEDLAKITGGHTVPQIIINNKAIGGFNELLQLNNSGKLKELLKDD